MTKLSQVRARKAEEFQQNPVKLNNSPMLSIVVPESTKLQSETVDKNDQH